MKVLVRIGLVVMGTVLQSFAQEKEEELMVADVPVRRNVLVNQAGYLPQGAKYFVVEGLGEGAPGTFRLVNVDVQSPKSVVHSGELRRVPGDFGAYHVGDFSQWTAPGKYVIWVKTPGPASFSSYTFRIGKDVYDDAISKGVHFHAVQRCGPSSTGYNAPCHLDDAIREDNNKFLDLVGGWHNSTDLLKWSRASLLSMHGLLNVAALTRDAKLRARIFEEIRWGNLFFHKLQDPTGYVYSHGVGGGRPQEGNHWTDNIRGTKDDRRAVTHVADMAQHHAFIWAQALVPQVYGDLDPDYAKVCLDRARRCFEWLTQSKQAEDTYASVGIGISAGVQMFRTTKKEKYKQYAVGMAERFMGLQEKEWVGNQREVRGFFYSDSGRKIGVNHIQVPDPLALIAFCELLDAFPDDAKAQSWRQALEMHCRDYVQVMASRNAFGLAPKGMRLAEAKKPDRFGSGGIPRNRKIGDLGFRYFPGGGAGHAARNCYRAGLAVALFKAARLLERPEWAALAQRQLDWVLGANPFGVSFMVDVGHVNPPEYVYTGFQPRTPWIPGATMQGVMGDQYDRPDLMPGHFTSSEFWTVHTSFLIWGLAEAKAYYNK